MDEPQASPPRHRLQDWAVAWVGFAIRRERLVLWTTLVVTLVLGAFAATHLGVNMDNKTTLLEEDLPFQERARVFESHFPLLNDALLVVVEAESGDAAREGARRLADALADRPEVARSVFVADADPFFERHALLYRSVEDLEEFSDQLVRFQPVLGELSQRPNLETLTDLIRRSLAEAAEPATSELAPLLDRFGDATVAVYAERPISVSWEDLLLRESSLRPGRLSTLIVDPVLDFEALLPAGRPIAAIREIAQDAGLDASSGLRVRITGYPALNDEEMRGLVLDVGVAGLFSFGMVLCVLGWAFRSARMVTAAAITLVVGLVWTAAFAAAVVGRVNVVSIAFAVLFIGLGVDFAIHLGLHVLAERSRGHDHPEAFDAATRNVGPALVLCAVTTSVGFFAFVPTDYKGVAELGLISGSGMFVIVFLTLTLFPALLTRWLAVAEARVPERGQSLAARVGPRWILLAAAALLVLAVGPALHARFDSNVVRMRNPDAESVQTWNDLLATGVGSPWYIDLLTSGLDEAERSGAALAALPDVAETRTLRSYVPEDQEEKQLLLEDLAFFLDVPPALEPGPQPSAEEQIDALRALHDSLGETELWRTGAFSESATLLRNRLHVFLERVQDEPNPGPVLESVEQSLLGRFPAQMDRLREALEPGTVELASLPPRLRERMLTDEGLARLQVFPTSDLSEDEALIAFVTAVQTIAPEATGLPVTLVEFGRATVTSLREALSIAGGVIVLLLLALWRRPGDALLALAPLGVAGLWTVGTLGALDVPFNFVNVVVLPLLLGMGVDSGIHLVSRARRDGTGISDLAATTTGRAVFLSAFTTLASFGSLASAGHKGISSLGVVLVIGMAFTLVANLWVLPAWFLPRAGALLRAETAPGSARTEA